MRVLLRFTHGLGDAVQFTIVLRHLQKYRPDWVVDVWSLYGKHSAFVGLCRQTFSDQTADPAHTDYDKIINIDWHECYDEFTNAPSTKAALCLRDVFAIEPDASLFFYKIAVGQNARDAATAYLRAITNAEPANGRWPVVLIHYEGNTSVGNKNLPHDVISRTCDAILEQQYTPVILDWDNRSPLPDNKTVFCPQGGHSLWRGRSTGDAEILAALAAQVSLVVGIDSGPLHVAGATDTPTVGVWTRHHPVHYFDLAKNVLHLVPDNHREFARHDGSFAFFATNYAYQPYTVLLNALPACVISQLTGEAFEHCVNKQFLRQLRSKSFDQAYYAEHKDAGLDYLGFGGWQQNYARWLVAALSWQNKRILDVGCACGAIVRGLGEAGVVTQGVDVNEHMIQLGRRQWPDMAELLRVCDAVNLHLYGDQSWDGIHTAQVAEHWQPDLVPFILRELHRVVKPGGLLFCALDTVELFARQNRQMEYEDPTHVCVKPLTWWHDALRAANWRVASDEYKQRLYDTPGSFLHQYDWDWFIAVRS